MGNTNFIHITSVEQYTFILPASKELPKQCTKYGATANASRKHVGVRMPDDAVCQAILRGLDAPLICTRSEFSSQQVFYYFYERFFTSLIVY